MTTADIQSLLNHKSFPNACSNPELIETHISWVILCDEFVYKIKKPVHYSFLDFSTLERRLYYCRRELLLNWRLTFNMYIDILPINVINSEVNINGPGGKVIDYAIRMKRIQADRQMNLLLVENKVTVAEVVSLARLIASFHKKARVIGKKNVLDIQLKFNDLQAEKDFLGGHLGKGSSHLIEESIHKSDTFIIEHREQFESRLTDGHYKDVHGDLHSRNIFLLPHPVVFDCIEFNDDYREIDVLNEIAFLCMDLDSFHHEELSSLFLKKYCQYNSLSFGKAEMELFVFYKAYRANVRAKVNSLRAKSAKTKAAENAALVECEKYLILMQSYLNKIQELATIC